MRLIFDLVQDAEFQRKFKAVNPALEVDTEREKPYLPAEEFGCVLTDRGMYVWFGDIPADVPRIA